LINFVNLSTTFFIQRFLKFSNFHKNTFFNDFCSWGQRFFTSMILSEISVKAKHQSDVCKKMS